MALLYLIRHAIAEERDARRFPDDALRPLTERGAARFRLAARGLARLAPTVDLVLASPYVRAWQTAEILATEAGWPPPDRCRALEAVQPPAAVLALLRSTQHSGAIALVGHEPGLSLLASLLLVGDAERLVLALAKGSATLLELPARPSPGTALLRWSLPPKALRQLAQRASVTPGAARYQRRGRPR